MQERQSVRLAVRQHHEPLLRQDQRPAQQVRRQVSVSTAATSRFLMSIANVLHRVKPKSLFAQASARKLRSDGALGETPKNP